MISAKTVSDFKIKKSKSGKLSVFYKGKQLLVFSERVLFQVILDTAPTYFLKSLAEISGIKKENAAYSSNIVRFATIYSFEKLKYFKGNVDSLNDSQVSESTKKLLGDRKNIKHFQDALDIMKNAGTTDISLFIKAQINGLKFVNDGKGTFPKPNQLATDNALTRLLEFNSVTGSDGDKQEKPEKYWYFDEKIDGEVALSNNAKYQEAIEKIKNKTASINAALYAKKCYSRRREGKSYFLIEDYLREIST